MPTRSAKRSASTERDRPTSLASTSIVQLCEGAACISDSALPTKGSPQTRQPAGLFRRKRLQMPAHHLDEHQLAEFGEDAFAAGALVRRFLERKTDELAEPACVTVLGISSLDHGRQILEQRIERPRIAGEIAADDPGRGSPVTADV